MTKEGIKGSTGTKRASQLFYDAFRASPIGIALEDMEGRPFFVNPALCSMLGFSEEELLRKHCVDFSPPEDAEKDWLLFQQLKAGAINSYHMDKRYFRRDGSLIWGRLSISLMNNGGPQMVVAMVEDITEKKAAQENLELAMKQNAMALQFQSLLSDLSRTFIGLPEEQVDANIERGLGQIGEFLEMDRIVLFEFSEDRTEMPTTFSWNTSGVPKARPAVRAEAVPWCMNYLLRGQAMLVSNLNDLPEDALLEREFFQQTGIISAAAIPLRLGNQINGGIVFITVRREVSWTEDLVDRLRVIGDIFWNAVKRKRAHELLLATQALVREREERFRIVANTAPVAIWMTDVDNNTTYVNQHWLDFTGRSFDSQLGNGWTEQVHPEDLSRSWETFERASDQREPFQMEYRFRRNDGEYRWILDSGTPRFGTDGSFAGYIGSAIDITERKQAEDVLSMLNQKLIEAQEEERKRIARDLHDDLSQRLALHCVDLDLVRQGLPAGSDAQRELARLLTDAQKVSIDVRRISHNLHHPQLALGLQHGAASFCREFSNQNGIGVKFEWEGDLRQIPETTSIVLFRVLQEALGNVAKHSGAERAIVSLSVEGDQIHLRVSDRGRGFDPASMHHHSGLGLISMRERLRLVGGTMKMASSVGQGTDIEAAVPVKMPWGVKSAST